MTIERGFDSLTVCCWGVASAGRREVEVARARAAGHRDAAILETCQRIEAYSSAACDCAAPARLQGLAALRHLTEVAAGLHSGVLGEAQVVGQVRRAFDDVPPRLRRLADLALASSRELRREAGFAGDSGDLLARALEIGAVPAAGTLLVLGTGLLGRLVAARGRTLGFADVLIAGRRSPDVGWLERSGAHFVRLGALRALPPLPVVAACLGGDAPPVTVDSLPAVSGLLVDLGTPHNLEGPFSTPIVTIAGILEHAARDGRRGELRTRLGAIVDRRVAETREDGRSLLGAWRRDVETVRVREVERIRRLHPELPHETVEAITRGLVNQLFHTPLARLRDTGDESFAQRFVSLFQQSRVAAR